MKNKCLVATLLLSFAFIQHAIAQSAGDYLSNGTSGGAWNNASTWLQYNGTTYVAAASAPSNSSSNIIVQAGDVVTVTASETITQLTVSTGASVLLSAGKTMTLNGSIIADGTLSINGTLVCGVNAVTGAGTFGLASGAAINIGSASGITSSASSGNIQTAIRIFSGSANYIYTSTAAQVTGNGLPAAVTGTITDNNTNTTSGLTLSQSVAVNSPGSFNVPASSVLTCTSSTNITGSGSFTLSSGAKFFIGHIYGISTTANTGNIQVTGAKSFSASANYTYNGTGSQVMGNAFPSPFTGALTVTNTNASGCALSNNLVVNSPGSLVVSGALACPAAFVILGTGTFSISSGGTLLTANVSGISAAGTSGSIQTTGSINFPVDGNYIYYGSAAQITGTGLPASVGGLYINNSSAANVSLTNSVVVNGNLTLNAGTFCLNGNTLTIATGKTIIRQSGTLSLCSGSLVYAGTVNLNYTGSINTTTGAEMPTSTSAITNFTVAMSAGKTLTLGNNVTVNGSVIMTSGSLVLGGNTLTYATGATLQYTGSAAQTVSEEWPGSAFNVNIFVKNSNAAAGVVPNANKTAYTGVLTVSSGGYFNTGGFTITGTGNVVVSSGGTFITPHPLGVSPSGAIQLTGTRTFASGSSYTFNGTSAQVTGTEMPANVSTLTINNTAAVPTVTLNNIGTGVQTITKTLALTAGVFDIASNTMSLTFFAGSTPVTQAAGSITTSTSSSLQFGIAGNTGGSAFTLPNNMFTVAPVINNLTINRANSLTLGNQNITLNGTLTLTAGVLDLANTTLIFQTGNTPVSVTAGSLTAGTGASLQFGTAGNTGGNAFTLPNTLFTSAPTFTNFTLNRTNALTLGTQNITLTGVLTLTNGQLNIASSTLGLNGTINSTGGVLNGGATSGLAIGGTGSSLTLPAITNNLGTLTVSRPNISSVPAVNLSTDLSVATNLNLSGGSLALGSANLTMGTSATITNMSTSRFVATNNSASSGGYLIRSAGASSVLFPVGTTTYTPALIDNSTGTADNFRVRVFDGILSAGTSGSAYINSTHSVNKTWLVEEAVAGGSSATLTMQWNAADENSLFDRTNSYISHYISSAWDLAAGSAASMESAGVYSQTRTGLTSFSPYSVQDRLTVLPVRWLQFTAAQKDAGVFLNWTVADEQNTLQFDVERSTNGMDFQKIGVVKAAGNVSAAHGYSFIDQTPSLQAIRYYRIRENDVDGSFYYSKLIFITGSLADAGVQLFPVPLKDVLTILINASTGKTAAIYIWDAGGRLVKKQAAALVTGSNAIQVPVAQLPRGMYTIQIIAGENSYSKKISK